MRQLNANIEHDCSANASGADSLMVAMIDTFPRVHPPSDNGDSIQAPTVFDGAQPPIVAPLLAPTMSLRRFVQNYKDMPAAVRAFITWLLPHEGRRFYIMDPVMAGYIEGSTKYDILIAVGHHQYDLTMRICSTSMFSLSICIALSEHQHWIHALNSLFGFLANEFVFAPPPDSNISDTDAIAFRTMNHQLALEKGEIDCDSRGCIF